jgi:beta-fructofuranosidase
MVKNFKYTSKIPVEHYPGNEASQKRLLKNSEQLKEFSLYRNKTKDMPYMPSYHFWAPNGMINDPNGLCFWKGNYHLFYQAYPPKDCRQHWGHTISKDLVHWKDLPLAIYPDIEYAVFSGSSLVEKNRVIAMYHGKKVGNMIATSSDPLLLNWEKNEKCPVIPLMPDSHDGKPYRVFDPFIWKECNGYYALSGCYYGEEDARSTGYNNKMVEHLFFSQNLSDWTYIGELAENGFPQIELGNDGACPYFWPIGKKDKYLLFHFSHRSGPHCYLGNYDKITHKFSPDKHIRFNFGPVGCSSYQAPCTTPDGNGGLYLIYNTKDANLTLQRQGCMTIVQHVTLDKNENLCFNPVEGINSLHSTHHINISNLKLAPFNESPIDISGKELDIRLQFKLTDARCLNIKVLQSSDKAEHTDINIYRSRIKQTKGMLTVYAAAMDTTFSSSSQNAEGRQPETEAVPDVKDGAFDIRILVDRCIIEVFINGRISMMQMIYPSEKSTHISLTSIGGPINIDKMAVWKMNSIY